MDQERPLLDNREAFSSMLNDSTIAIPKQQLSEDKGVINASGNR